MMKMEALHIAYALLFFCLHAIFCFPSKPLDERTTNLTWQAWLLVGDQNNSRYYDSDVLKTRRITPKSVFIAPTFSPESLPACREGYLPDSMGRCIKIVKINEEARLEFLLEKLNAQFGDDEEPFQVNIPLNGVEEEEEADSQDIAIVVAPTNGNYGVEGEVKAAMDKNNLHSQQKKSPEGENHSTTLDITTTQKMDQTTLEIIEETTTFEPTTEILTQTPEATELFTEQPTPNKLEVTYKLEPLETTTDPVHALFFLKPSLHTAHVQNGTNNTEGTPVTESNNSLTTRLSNPTFVIDTSININNKDHLPVNVRQKQNAPSVQFPNSDDLMTSENVHQSGFVRFPTQDDTSPQLDLDPIIYPERAPENTYADQFRYKTPSESYNLFHFNTPKRSPNTNQNNFFENYTPSRGISLNERLVYDGQLDQDRRDRVNINEYQTNLEHKYTKYPILNRRNRDKHNSLWSLPPFSVNSSPHKPIVLRFRGRSANSRQILEQRLRPHTDSSQAFYREFPTEDFSYIFGIDEDQNHRRNTR